MTENMKIITNDEDMVEVINKNADKFKIGDTVHWMNSWGDYQWGTISGFVEDKVAIYGEGKTGIHTGARLNQCWATKDELLRADKRRAMEQTKVYEEAIKNVDDLVRFLFNHQVTGEDRDYDAEEAARNKAAAFRIEL